MNYVTIKDVAKAAGISPSSVSRFFHSPELLTEDMRQKIEKVVEELNYKPNAIASNLRGGRTNIIALIMPSLMNLYYIDIYAAIRNAILPLGYSVNLYTTDFKPDLLREHLVHAAQCNYDGVIVCFLDDYDARDVLHEAQNLIPIVLLTSDPDNTHFDNVYVDAFDGIMQVTQHIVETGKTRIAFISGSEKSIFTKEKLNGYRAALEKAKLDFNEEYVFYGEHNHHYTGYMAMRHFFAMPVPPDAIVCATDDVAIGCLKYLLERGVEIPKEVALSGFNGISMLSTYSPSITTVAQAIQTEAKSAVELLLDRIANPRNHKKRIGYKVSLVVGKTTVADAPESYMTVLL